MTCFLAGATPILCMWLLFVRVQRYNRRTLHAQMAASGRTMTFEEMEMIVRNIHLYEFPWLIKTYLYFGTLKMFAVPSISAILARSRIMAALPSSRYYSTDTLIRRIFEYGVNTTRGQANLKRMNDAHGKYKLIQNDDMVYGIAGLVVGVIGAINSHGWRKLLPEEEEVIFQYWVGHNESVGQRMHIENLPKSLNALLEYVREYEETKIKFAPSNEIIVTASFDSAVSAYPQALHPMLRKMVSTQLDAKHREAMKFPDPGAEVQLLVDTILKSIAFSVRYLCPPLVKPVVD